MITELRYQMKCGEQGVHELLPPTALWEKGGRSGDSVRLYNGNSVLEFLGDTQQGGGGVGLGLFALHHLIIMTVTSMDMTYFAKPKLYKTKNPFGFSLKSCMTSVTSSPVTICHAVLSCLSESSVVSTVSCLLRASRRWVARQCERSAGRVSCFAFERAPNGLIVCCVTIPRNV
jgi:hypothetical protein